MSITIDGANRLIKLDTTKDWNWNDIYVAIIDWSCLSTNMQYTLPCSAVGKAEIVSGSIYSDIIYTILEGWKVQASGYASTDILNILGTVVALGGASRIVPPAVGSNPQWQWNPASYGVVVSGGGGSGGLTTTEHDKLMGLRNASALIDGEVII